MTTIEQCFELEDYENKTDVGREMLLNDDWGDDTYITDCDVLATMSFYGRIWLDGAWIEG